LKASAMFAGELAVFDTSGAGACVADAHQGRMQEIRKM
jgi:hypothetical protein